MAIVTVSRQLGSRGSKIAERVGDALNYKMIDKEEINNRISSYKADFSREMDTIREQSEPGFFGKFMYNRSVYVNLVRSLILSAASRDNVIIQGRGGQYILAGYPFVLRARIIAPLTTRIATIQESRGIDRRLAKKIVTKTDHERQGFVHYLYKADNKDSLSFDITINTEMFDEQGAVKLLVDKVRSIERAHPMSEKIKSDFVRQSIEASVKATIQKEIVESIHVDVEAQADGTIKLTGYISSQEEKQKAAECAISIDGVQSVKNTILVFDSSFTIH